MKNFFKKILGLDKLEKETEEIKERNRLAKLSPKELATERKEPWVTVLNTHVNKENIRNGFFELDWNEYFVLELRKAGYNGDTEEAIVDQWFSELCRNLAAEEGIDMSRRGTGFINVNNLGDGRTEVS